ncbi:MAG: thiamine phosphate synthase [Sphingomonadales bacterium]|nr:thiamine phosphate synthase [Sphingomonadales bacterium]
MRRRHPLPRIWLMTDERIIDLKAAIERLPRESGIVFRHYSLDHRERRALFDQVLQIARRYRHVVLLAGAPELAKAWGADGAHHRSMLKSRGLRSVAVHTGAEKVMAVRIRADLMFISPVFETKSHPGKSHLGRVRLALLAGNQRFRTIALGGLNGKRATSLSALKLYGWAAIDAFGRP